MRKQIAAANWKMNLTFQQGEKLLDDIFNADIKLKEHQQTVFAVPFPYLLMARSEVEEQRNYYVAAQNCYHRKNGAFTGEVSWKCCILWLFHIASWGIVSDGNILMNRMQCWLIRLTFVLRILQLLFSVAEN